VCLVRCGVHPHLSLGLAVSSVINLTFLFALEHLRDNVTCDGVDVASGIFVVCH